LSGQSIRSSQRFVQAHFVEDNDSPVLKRIPMTDLPLKVWTDYTGQDIAEYAVMLAVILVLVVGTTRLVGSNANKAFSSVASSIHSGNSSCLENQHRHMRCTLLTLLSLVLAGCYHQKPSTLPDILIPKECVNHDVVLKQCDTRSNPPRCKQSVIDYKAGCEQVVVKQ
jgi:Flp pilus assembly pilin Flp